MSARSPLTAYGNVRVGPPAMSFVHSQFSPTTFLRFKRPSFSQKECFRPNRRGRFFRAKAQKKSAPDGSAKRVFYE
jgi:hypothetical protein